MIEGSSCLRAPSRADLEPQALNMVTITALGALPVVYALRAVVQRVVEVPGAAVDAVVGTEVGAEVVEV